MTGAIRSLSPERFRTFLRPATGLCRECASHGARLSATPGRCRKSWKSAKGRSVCSKSLDALSTTSRLSMDSDPSDMWMAEFYAGVGTRLKDVLANSPDQLDPAVAEVLDGALDQTLEEYYTQVFRRYEFRERFRQFMQSYDLLVTPTLPVAAFDVGLNTPPELPRANIISWVAYTYPFNLTGNSSGVPAGWLYRGRSSRRPADHFQGHQRRRHFSRRRGL